MDFDALHIRRLSELDRLPWFAKDEAGDIGIAPEAGLPPIIDAHAHIGWSYGFSKRIDMAARPRLRYLLNYDFDQEFLNGEEHPTREEERIMWRECLQTGFVRPPFAQTHTAANLAADMDRLNICSTWLMPIAIPLHTRHAFETLDACKLDSRLVPFAAVHPWPWGPKKSALLDRQFAAGAKGLKYHPEFQFIAPDNRHMMELFAWCAERDVVILAHTGWCGSEPAWMKRKAEPERFRPVLEAFPNLRMIFGHTAIKQWRQALAVARDFDEQVWLETSGLFGEALQTVLNGYAVEKILFGSDWPFVPQAVQLARILIGTETRQEDRTGLLHNNAARLLGLPLV